MADEFVTPDFLEDCDIDSVHERMLSLLPDDIDKIQGGFVWDLTRPSASVVSEVLEFYMPLILRLMFAQWSSGDYLDMLGNVAQVTRREAQTAVVAITVTGDPGTVIPSGTIFSTPDIDEDEEAVEFTSDSQAVIGEDGKVSISATAVSAGKDSNVEAGTVTLLDVSIEGVATVTNPEKASGGTDEEDDDTFRERVLEGYKHTDESYVGNDADFKRWAESVDGMGTALVISKWDDPGVDPETVKIVCTDANGEPASQLILDAIYNLIMSPDSAIDRLAPPNTILIVDAPKKVDVEYSVTVELEADYDLDTVRANIISNLNAYYVSVPGEGGVKYSRVGAVISSTVGVNDFKDLTINGGTSNVQISKEEYPNTKSIALAQGKDVND